MKGVFWNSRGLNDLAKHRRLAELVKKNQLDFLALLETGKTDFSQACLRNLSGGLDYMWHCKPSTGRSGGILLGINLAIFDIGSIVEGEFFVKFRIRNRCDGFQWILVTVYGAAQPEYKN